MGKGLRANGLENPAQNLVLQGVTAKILWNKDLARLAEVLLGLLVENGRGRLWRTFSSLRSAEFSVKVVRHRIAEYFCGRLWKRAGPSRILSVMQSSRGFCLAGGVR